MNSPWILLEFACQNCARALNEIHEIKRPQDICLPSTFLVVIENVFAIDTSENELERLHKKKARGQNVSKRHQRNDFDVIPAINLFGDNELFKGA